MQARLYSVDLGIGNAKVAVPVLHSCHPFNCRFRSRVVESQRVEHVLRIDAHTPRPRSSHRGSARWIPEAAPYHHHNQTTRGGFRQPALSYPRDAADACAQMSIRFNDLKICLRRPSRPIDVTKSPGLSYASGISSNNQIRDDMISWHSTVFSLPTGAVNQSQSVDGLTSRDPPGVLRQRLKRTPRHSLEIGALLFSLTPLLCQRELGSACSVRCRSSTRLNRSLLSREKEINPSHQVLSSIAPNPKSAYTENHCWPTCVVWRQARSYEDNQ